MYDLASHAQQMDPQQRQVMTAQLLRQRAQAAALQEASQRANQYGGMAAVTQMANNPELAAAAQMLHQNTQRRHAPVSMGQQGFAIPSTGEFVESPMYSEEKDAARAATRDNARSRFEASLAAQREREQSRADLEAQRAADRAERDRERAIDRGENKAADRVQRAELEAQRASDRAESRQLRLTLAAIAGANKDKKPEKEPLTAKQQQAVLDNRANMGAIDAAHARVEAMPDAFGLKNILPDELMQRLPGKGYSDGVAARAAVQNIGSLKIHDRSGAAVTAAEFPRLKQFVPLTKDTPEVVKEKLAQFREEYARVLEEIEQGYPMSHFLKEVKKGTGTIVPASPNAVRPGIALPRAIPSRGPRPGTIENGYRFKGGNAGDPSAWEKV